MKNLSTCSSGSKLSLAASIRSSYVVDLEAAEMFAKPSEQLKNRHQKGGLSWEKK